MSATPVLPPDTELHMYYASHDWLISEHQKIEQIVTYHEQELLLTGIILTGMIVIQSALAVEVWKLRKEVKCRS